MAHVGVSAAFSPIIHEKWIFVQRDGGDFVKEMYVRLRSFQDVQSLASMASTCEYRVMITDGNRTVNAKSIMCMFSVNMRRPVLLLLDCDEEDFEVFRIMAGRFEADPI